MKHARVLLGLILLGVCVALWVQLTGFAITVYIKPLNLLTLVIVLAAMLIITKEFGVFARCVRFLFSGKGSLAENDFKAADSLLKSFSKVIIMFSALIALFHICQSETDIDAILHVVRMGIGDMATGLLLVLFIIHPMQTTLESKFYAEH